MHRSRTTATLVATLALAAALPAHGVMAADPPVTLRFAIVGGEDDGMAPYANAFIEEAARRSGGSVVLQPVWAAGGGAATGYEQGVARLLVDGSADLALTASRAWDAAGITGLEALETPFLITDDAIAAAVSTSSIADDLLAGMADGGAIGLAMWNEGLQHFVNLSCLAPVTAPDQLAGKVIRAVPSAVTLELIETLDATHVFYDEYGPYADACKIHALIASLNRTGPVLGLHTFTGDVTLSPKFEVLAANRTAFDRLAPGQQQVLRDAAHAARDRAIAEYQPEADAAAAWCAKGGSVALAGPDAVAAFEAALQPVSDRLMTDPVAAGAIEAIQALKKAVPPAPGAGPCGPAPVETAQAYQSPDTTGYVGTLPPDGTYRADVREEDLLAADASPRFAEVQAKLYTLTFEADTALWTEGDRSPCENDATSDGTSFSIRERIADTCLGGDYLWREVPGGIELLPLLPPNMAAQDAIDMTALFHRVWTRIE